MISEVQAEAERKCKILRERHNEQEILVGKLMASSESLSKRIQEADRLTEEHDEMIKNIIKYTGEKFEDFEHRLVVGARCRGRKSADEDLVRLTPCSCLGVVCAFWVLPRKGA